MYLKAILACAAACSLAGCATVTKDGRTLFPDTTSKAYIPDKTQTQTLLEALPAPDRPVAVAVYGFSDQTGQFKPTDQGQTLSRAVSQGGASILVKALQDAGNRQWFTIVERESLKNLLNERQIIREMRERYLGEQGVNPQALPALLFAGVLLEGGIVGYDTNTVTGGVGAAFLGIGGHTEYRQDTVTVYLRAVSVRTGEVLTTVTASKTIASQGVGASAFRYVAFKDLLQADAGYTTNEPDQVALQQAIEKAVWELVLDGAELKLWNFANPAAATPLLDEYTRERSGELSATQVAEALKNAPATAPLKIKRTAAVDADDKALGRLKGARGRD
jgi:curli production assembly/transport component CsgG